MDKKAVINTSPLISLNILDKLDLLGKIFTKVYIPEGVYQEFIEGYQSEGNTDNIFKDYKFIEMVAIGDERKIDFLYELDKGEAEVLVVAEELKIKTVILDEQLARFIAENMGFNVTGALGILLYAKKKGFIQSIRNEINTLLDNNRWFSQRLIDDILQIANEI